MENNFKLSATMNKHKGFFYPKQLFQQEIQNKVSNKKMDLSHQTFNM